MGIINNYFDKVYVINLDRRKDRWEKVNKNLSDLNIEYERVSGVEARDIGLRGFEACTMSHIKVFLDAKEKGFKKILIFEDDVIFNNNFYEIFSKTIDLVPSDWDMLYLGANILEKDQALSDTLVKIKSAYAAHAYAVQDKCFDYILKILHQREPVDLTYSKIHKYMNVYSFYPAICHQEPGFSDIANMFVDYKDLIK